ncbi:HAD family hydrolase [Oleispirillum naphthae]|uniref:HAD family hydrolase n=1 Tax=Oleispirillum naphthae TaxID=2838853 RepID=UPI0030826411
MAQGLYVLHLSLHGLIRGRDLELGRDADTGGQTLYVVELARALGKHPEVERVDLLTRRIDDPAVDADYAKAVERVAPGVRIVRIPAGPPDYIRKELLWDHLDGMADTAAEFLREQDRLPDVIHSHYADAGYVGVRLARLFGRPLVHTGHSLGRVKRLRLLAAGMDGEDIETRYAMQRRIEAEEKTLSTADLVIASTHNEVTEQYELYDCYHPDGMAVIPPGVNLTRFHPPEGDEAETPLAAEIGRFLRRPKKPMVLAIARPDERKNLPALVEAFGNEPKLRARANLVIVPGTRDDIRDMDEGSREVLKDLLLAIDRHDLYGSIAMPKSVTEVPLMYRLAAASKGVFVNPALTEPFGLTLLEAAASGLPLVATHDGGPTDIIRNCDNGLLVDPLDPADIGRALRALLFSPKEWRRLRDNGLVNVAHHYSWAAHADTYVHRILPLVGKAAEARPAVRRHSVYADRALIADLDQVLIGDGESLTRLCELLRANRKDAAFGIATGRPLDSALRVIRRHGIPAPDILITALGTEIHYGPRLLPDNWWERHIDHQWNPRAVRRILAGIDGVTLQPQNQQTFYKVSYYYDGTVAPKFEDLQSLFYQAELTVNPVLSYGQFLDILPSRAGKGMALRYAAHQLDIPLERILVAGGSGSDANMMRGNTLAVIVADRHDDELESLAELDRVFRPEGKHAAGILEAIAAFDFFGACAFPAPAAEAAEPAPQKEETP